MSQDFDKKITKAAHLLEREIEGKEGEIEPLKKEQQGEIEPLKKERQEDETKQMVVLTKNQKKQRPRLAAVFIRNCLRSVLKGSFHQITKRHILKRTCWRLVASKRRREMESAFQTIRSHSSSLAMGKIVKFYSSLPQLKIMSAICNKILAKPQRRSVDLIRAASFRRKKVQEFCATLSDRWSQWAWREGSRLLFSQLAGISARQCQKQVGVQQIAAWARSRGRRLLQISFVKLRDSVELRQCSQGLEQWREKKERVKTRESNRKESLVRVREELKKTKPVIDEQKLEKHKVFQDYKKKQGQSKKQMADLAKQFQKERKEERAQFDAIEEELRQWERLLEDRKQITSKQEHSQRTCFNLYKILVEKEENFRGMETAIPELQSEVGRFRDSQNYYFLKNLEMGKLVELFEKREPYNYEAEYYELEYENRVVRQTLRCFIREKYEASINQKKKEIRQMSHFSLVLEESQQWQREAQCTKADNCDSGRWWMKSGVL